MCMLFVCPEIQYLLLIFMDSIPSHAAIAWAASSDVILVDSNLCLRRGGGGRGVCLLYRFVSYPGLLLLFQSAFLEICIILVY